MYIGSRSCNVKPEKDIGVEYFSSSGDKEFMTDQRNNPSDYAYKVINTFGCRVDALSLEIKLHQEFNVANDPMFYNRAKQTSTGFNMYGKKLSDITKQKMSDAGKGKKRSDETRKKISDVRKGKKFSAESRKKMSTIKMGKTHSDKTKKKMSDAQKGKTHSDKTKKKISDAGKGKKRSDETRKKISEATKGIPKETGKCPHCLKVCSLGMLSRWHLDACKLNPNKQD